MNVNAFKAYDIRGEFPTEINQNLAYKLGFAFVEEYQAARVVVGRDIRLSSPALFVALTQGITAAGADVIDLGICGTEEVYFNTVAYNADGGIMITASHNPKHHNGFKMVGRGAEPISYEMGIAALQKRIFGYDDQPKAQKTGVIEKVDNRDAYIEKLLSFAPQLLQESDFSYHKPLKVVCNSGNGCAGDIIDRLEVILKKTVTFIKVHHEPDGEFPNGVPNPLLHDRREDTRQAVLKHRADFGVAWDGDFDRCFFFDEKGEFIDSSYIVGLMAKELLHHSPQATIVVDTRQTLNSESVVKKAGGRLVISAGGHSLMKQTMRNEKAIYGGEMSAHHYFKAFSYCDSGMIPLLLMIDLLRNEAGSLGQLVEDARRSYPCSGELNYLVENSDVVIKQLSLLFQSRAIAEDYLDGLSIRLPKARINIRASNTERYLRINIETEGDTDLVISLQKEIEGALAPFLLML